MRAALLVLALAACAPRRAPPPDAMRPDAGLVPARAPGEHPRIILSAARVQALRAAAQKQTPAWRALVAECKSAADEQQPGVYEGFNWTEALANLSLCWHATGDERWARAAMIYFNALLDDKDRIGDGKGGDTAARHDSGYAIRTYGAFTALGLDWLHAAPGMTPALRARAAARLGAWLAWYQESGYLRDEPVSNYFFGYLTTAIFAGLALHGEHPDGERWLALGRQTLLEGKVIPAFRERLRGGDWPEGWQYGEYVTIQLALLVEGMRTALGLDYLEQLPWLRDTVYLQLHATVPGLNSRNGHGVWGKRPPEPSAWPLLAAAFVLDGVDDTRAAHARFLAGLMPPPAPRQRRWLRLLVDRPDAPAVDPRPGQALFWDLPGEGRSYHRSDWGKQATWVSFQAGPKVAADHQNADQGQLEVWHGADALITDNGEHDGISSLVHNTLRIDDGRRVMTYLGAQGPWALDVRRTGFHDDGKVAVVVGDLTDAYSPACRHADPPCDKTSVKSVVRTFVYLRPGIVVVADRVELVSGEDGVTWAAHFVAAPVASGATTRVSVATITTLEPAATHRILRAPFAPSGPKLWEQAKTHPDTWRLEVDTPRGGTTRALLHWIAVASDEPVRITGSLHGGWSRAGAVLVADRPAGGEATLPGPAEVVVVGLTPDAPYTVSTAGCRISVRPGGEARSSPAGSLRARCP